MFIRLSYDIIFFTYLKYILECNSKYDNERENAMVMIVWIINPLGINERIIAQLQINNTKTNKY